MTEFNIVVFASNGGGNFETLAKNADKYGYNVVKIFCDKPCGAIDKAKLNNIPYEIINKKELGEKFFIELDKKIPDNIDLIVLAGFMPILPKNFCEKWKNKIINTHPSLLPKYGGKGMYGVKVQESVMANKEKYAGCTVHYVNEKIDGGDIIFQKKIPVNYNETPWQLGGRIFNEEAPLLIKAIQRIKSEKNMQKVSVSVIAYNQKDYIRQCLDSILMQKTNFEFEILIHDDCSTDGTTEIIKEYEQNFPDIIKPIYEDNNQFSKGINITKTYNLSRVKGEYVALCEGDDYWTDPYKLQKQVDFLEQNPDYTICFHNVKQVFENSSKTPFIFPEQSNQAGVIPFTFDSLIECNFIATNSVMYRWKAVENIVEKIPDKILPGDWYLHLLFAKQGKIKFIEDVMSVYRVNSAGVWATLEEDKKIFLYAQKLINFRYNVYEKIVVNKKRYYQHLLQLCEKIQRVMIKNKKYLFLITFFVKYPILNLQAIVRKAKLTYYIVA